MTLNDDYQYCTACCNYVNLRYAETKTKPYDDQLPEDYTECPTCGKWHDDYEEIDIDALIEERNILKDQLAIAKRRF